MPSSCSVGKPTNVCKFVFWNDNPDGWCQLAEDGCMTQSEYNSNSYDSFVLTDNVTFKLPYNYSRAWDRRRAGNNCRAWKICQK